MASSSSEDPPEVPSGNDARRWMRATNGIAAVVVGFVLFGIGVASSLGPVEVGGAVVIVGGGVTLLRALLAGSQF
jgi:hypothetical protein